MKAKTGTFLGIPYDWRAPTGAVIKERIWNPQDRHIFTPHVFGWGWPVNLYEVLRRVGLVGRQRGKRARGAERRGTQGGASA